MHYLSGSQVLVTGAAGFIGSHLTHRLVESGCDVRVLVRPTSAMSRLASVVDRIEVRRADLRDFGALVEALRGLRPRFVFHLAAFVDVRRELALAQQMVDTNLQGTINLLRALEHVPFECFVNTGTCEEYGPIEAPYVEQQLVQPVSPYSASKAATTLFCRMAHATLKLPIVTVRPFLAYGPGQNLERLLPQAVVAALDGQDFRMTLGEQRREFNFVSDIVDGYLQVAGCPQVLGEVINISNCTPYRICDVVAKIYDMTGSRGKVLLGALPYRANEVWELFGDNTRARQLLGWQPRVGLEEGLHATIAWYQNHGRK